MPNMRLTLLTEPTLSLGLGMALRGIAGPPGVVLNYFGFGVFTKADASTVAFTKTGANTATLKGGTYIDVVGTPLTFAADTAITMPTLVAGTDYAIYACTDGTVRADAGTSAPTGYTTANSRKIGLGRFARYMDDVVVIGHSQEAMSLLQLQAASFANHHMGLKFSRWSVQPWQRGVNFCGYRIWPTHKLLRRDSVRRAKNKLAGFTATGDAESRAKFLAAWRGHAQWADCRNLLTHLGVTQ